MKVLVPSGLSNHHSIDGVMLVPKSRGGSIGNW